MGFLLITLPSSKISKMSIEPLISVLLSTHFWRTIRTQSLQGKMSSGRFLFREFWGKRDCFFDCSSRSITSSHLGMNKYFQILSYKSIPGPLLRIPDAAHLKLITNYASGQRFTVAGKYVDVETAEPTGRSGIASWTHLERLSAFAEDHGLCPWMNADSAVRSFVCRWAPSAFFHLIVLS